MSIFIIVQEWEVGTDRIEKDVISTTKAYGRDPFPYFTSLVDASNFIKSLDATHLGYRVLEIFPSP